MTKTTNGAALATKDEHEPATTKKDRAPKVLSLPAAQRGLAAFAPEFGDKTATRATPVLLDVSKIDVDPRLNVTPVNDEKVEGYAATMRSIGQQLPIDVSLKPDGRFLLNNGRHRLAAARKLGHEKILAFVIEGRSEVEAHLSKIVQDHQHRDVSPYEEAVDYKRLVDSGMSQEQVAETLGVAKGKVNNRLKLLQLPEDLAKRVGEPAFTAAHAEVLIPLVKHETALAAARKVIGRKDYDEKPLDAEAFEAEVIGELEEKGLVKDLSHGYYDVRSKPSFKKAVEALPQVTIGKGQNASTLVLDVKALDEIAEKERAAARAKDAPSGARASTPSWTAQERERAALYKEVRRRVDASIVKVVGTVKQFGPRERNLLAAAYLLDINTSKNSKKIAAATGIPVKTLESLGRKKILEFVDTLGKKKDDGEALAKLTTACALLRMSEQVSHYSPAGDDVWGEITQAWFGVRQAETNTKIKKDLAAAKKEKKAGKKGKGKKAGKAKAAAGDDEDLDDQGDDADGDE